MPARPATQRTQAKSPGDLTGVRGQQLAANAAREKSESAAQVKDALREDKAAKLATVVDYTGTQTAEPEVVETEVEVKPTVRRIRVNYPIQDMTFGKEILHPAEFDEDGNMTKMPVLGNLRSYTFEEGVRYDVPADVADHLAFLGYIWD